MSTVSGLKVTPTGVLAAPSGVPEAEWLKLRQTGIGGSDIGALVGLSRYTSPYELYLDKRGELPDLPRSEGLARAARWGHLHETALAGEFAQRHDLKVRRMGLIRHESEPWRLANLDRQVLGCPDGPCLLECKTRSAYKASEWGESGDPEGVPDTEALQTHWYMSVTGYGHAHVAVLINGNDDRYYRLERDTDVEGDVLAMARSFWQRVQDGNPPPVDGSEAVSELFAHLWAGREGAEKVIPADAIEPLKAKLGTIKAEISRLEAEEASAKNQLAFMLGDAEAAVWDGQTLVTRKQNGTFSAKRFEQAHPELAAQYTHMVPAINAKALAADHPDIYRAFRARILRFPGSKK